MFRRSMTLVLIATLMLGMVACSVTTQEMQRNPSSGNLIFGSGESTGTVATVNRNYTLVYDKPSGNCINTLYEGDTVRIRHIEEEWAKTDKGWIEIECLDYDMQSDHEVESTVGMEQTTPQTDPDGNNTDQLTALFSTALRGEITGDTLRIRDYPGNGEVLGHLDTGDQIVITNITHVNDTLWCYIGYGWVSMDFVMLPEFDVNKGFTAWFKSETKLHYEAGGGASGSSLPANSTANIWELYSIGDTIWGKTSKGWVNMSAATLPYGVYLTTGVYMPLDDLQ